MNESLLAGDNNAKPEIKLDDNVNYYEMLVGDNAKFKTKEELAKGKAHSDEYIKFLEGKMDEYREDQMKMMNELRARTTLEDLLDQRLNQKEQPVTQKKPDVEMPEMPDPKEIESLIQRKITENESSKKQTENYNLVKARLQERYGSNYANVLKENIDNLGLNEEFVNQLARNHPQVLFKTLGLDEQQKDDSFLSPPRSSTRSDSFKPQVQKRTWSFYQRMKKEDPKKYRDPQTHVQMWKDQVELGSAFEDGDFHSVR